MKAGRLLALAASLLALNGCAVATGFKGPGYDRARGVTAPGSGPVVVALTKAVLRPDGDARDRFRAQVRAIDAAMRDQPGLVGYALRMEPLGDTVWTMTVWRDEDSLRAFVRGDAHRTAVRTSMDAVETSVFARVPMDRAAVPPSWDQALAILDRDGYSYR